MNESPYKVAALYIDPRGPYPPMESVDSWDEVRDARTYNGPLPVVAHPPCGPWGQLRSRYKGTEHDCAPLAVESVRRFGGVLEHPRNSLLWAACGLPRPGEQPDTFGGFTIQVDQVEWGHTCRKPTWLYLVGIPQPAITPPPFPGAKPTHGIWYGKLERARGAPKLLLASKEKRRRTPPKFAEWLVALASIAARNTGGAQ